MLVWNQTCLVSRCLPPDVHMGRLHVVVGFRRSRSDTKEEEASY